jgi:mannose-6-phosphate isomerase
MLEWKDVPLGGVDPLLGISRDEALAAVRREPVTADELAHLGSRRGSRFFPHEADAFFRAEETTAGEELDPGFAILVALEGEGTLESAAGGSLPLGRGDAALVPHAAGAFRLTGSLSSLVCRPPAAD